MTRVGSALLVVFGLAAPGALHAACDPPAVWTRVYDGPAADTDVLNALGFDGAGNVVAGITESFASTSQWRVITYSTAGAVLWSRSFPGGTPSGGHALRGIAVEGSGAVFAGGQEDLGTVTRWRLIKYDAGGSVLWTRTHDGAGSGSDMIASIVRDSAGGVVVAGMESTLSNPDGRVIRYDGNGTLVWSRSHDDPQGGYDVFQSVAVDAANRVTAVGYGDAGIAGSWIVNRYDGAGTLLWQRTHSGSGGGGDTATAVAVDDAGNSWVAGFERNAAGNDDWRIIRYDGNGAVVWSRSFDGSAGSGDYPDEVRTDGSGDAWVAGLDEDAGGSRWRVTRYGATGAVVWTRSHIGTPGSSSNDVWDMAVDGHGGVMVGGREENSKNIDWRVIHFDPAGGILWTRSHDGPANGADVGSVVALGPGGRSAFAGQEAGPSSDDVRIILYDVSGCFPATPTPVIDAATTAVPVVPFPNPVPGDRVTIGVNLAEDAVRVEVEIFNAAMQRVRRAVWADVTVADGGVVMDGLLKIMPGVYLLRVRAIQRDGDEQRFAPVRLVLQRAASK